MLTKDGYQLNYTYTGDEGTFHFLYTVRGDGDEILTELLEGSSRGSGTRIYYNRAKDSENVFMDTGFITLRRSLEARDIKGSSLYQPLLRQLVQEFASEQPTKVQQSKEGGLLFFGKRGESEDRLRVDATGAPMNYRRLEKGTEVKNIEIQKIVWGKHPIKWNP